MLMSRSYWTSFLIKQEKASWKNRVFMFFIKQRVSESMSLMLFTITFNGEEIKH